MLTLNTLRTKFGIVLSIVIVLALLAFVLTLDSNWMNFGGDQNPEVAEVNGEEITYMEYSQAYNSVQTTNDFFSKIYGQPLPNTEDYSAQVATAVWMQTLLDKYYILEFEQAGIAVTPAEEEALLDGIINSTTYAQVFGPAYATDMFNILSECQSAAAGAEMNQLVEQAWPLIKAQAKRDRYLEKFFSVVRAGSYVNSLEVEQSLNNNNNVADGRYITVRLNTIPDSEVEVKESEVKAYYDAHKELYRKSATRDISYVVFDVLPSAEDEAAIEAKAAKLGEELAAAENEEQILEVVSKIGVPPTQYELKSALTEDEAVICEGGVYGPVRNGNNWEMSRVVKQMVAPESIDLSMMIIAGDDVATLKESIIAEAKEGADFTALAEKNGLPEGTYMTQTVPFSTFDASMAEKLAAAEVGEVIVEEQQGAVQIVRVDKKVGKSDYLLVGRIEVPVVASSATVQKASDDAKAFAAKAAGSVANFNKAASEAGVMARVHTIAEGDYMLQTMNPMYGGAMPVMESSHQIVQWAAGAEKNAVSEVFQAGDDFVVAMLTNIDESRYEPLTEQSKLIIAKKLMDEKRVEILKKQYAGLGIEAAAEKAGEDTEIQKFENLAFSATSVNNQFYGDPSVVGALTTSGVADEVKVAIAPMNSMAVIYVVDAVKQVESPKSAEDERLNLQTKRDAFVMQQGASTAMYSISNTIETKNNTAKYF
ncbi:MAG: SurA N-terminal domain-containing protein [Alistipes sp.]|nr:SurA N-terminal domain-containing protein [Alistipes sp.]